MGLIQRKTWRDIRKMKLRGLAIVSAVAIWVALFGAFRMGLNSVVKSLDHILAELHLADLEVFIEPSEADELPRTEDLEGVQTCQKRLFCRGVVALKENDPLQQKGHLPVYVICDDPARSSPINLLKTLGEELPPARLNPQLPQVIIDRTMASAHGFQPGDTLEVLIQGTPLAMQIKGIALSPEFLFPSVNPDLQIPTIGSLGVIFAPLKQVADLLGYPLYNNLAFRFDPAFDRRELERKIYERCSDTRIEYFVPQRESFDQKILKGIIDGGRKFAPIGDVIIGIVVFIVVFVNVYRLMEERRREIGVMLAVGVRRASLFWMHTYVCLVFIIVGCLLGLVLSFVLLPFFAERFAEPIRLPALTLVPSPAEPAKGMLISFCIGLIAAATSSLRVFRLLPCEAISGRSRELRAAMPGRVSLALARQSLSVRYGLRNLLRRRSLTLVTILSISLVLALAVSFNILSTSLNGTMKGFFSSDPWDLVVDFRIPLDATEVGNLFARDSGARYEGYLKGFCELEVPGNLAADKLALGNTSGAAGSRARQRSFAQLIGLKSASSMRRLQLVEGSGFSGDQANEVILNRNLWKTKALHLGQSIVIESYREEYPLTVVGFVDEVTINIEYAYLPVGTAQRILKQDGKFSGAWLFSSSPPEQVSEALYKSDLVAQVVPKTAIAGIIDRYISDLKVALSLVNFITIVMAPFFLFTSIGLSIMEREMDFVILRSTGFKGRDILKILMTEATVMGGIGTLLSIPLALAMGVIQNRWGSEIYYAIRTHVEIGDYAYILPCLLLFPLLAGTFARRILKLDLAEKLARRLA